MESARLLPDLTRKMAEKVEEFQTQVQGMKTPLALSRLTPERMKFRVGHMREELDEFETAWAADNFSQQVDGIVDLLYVATGALLEMGISPNQVFAEVHEANMRKVKGETKRANSGGFDAVKPAGWTPPDIDAVLEEMRIRWAVDPQLVEVTRLSLAKNEDYNSETSRDAYFPYGDISYMQMIWTKVSRAKNLVGRAMKGKKTNFEGIRDTLRDIINYAVYWLDWLERHDGIWKARAEEDGGQR